MYYRVYFTTEADIGNPDSLLVKNSEISDELYKETNNGCRIYLLRANIEDMSLIIQTSLEFERNDKVDSWIERFLEEMEIKASNIKVNQQEFKIFSRFIANFGRNHDDDVLVDEEMLEFFNINQRSCTFIYEDCILKRNSKSKITDLEYELEEEMTRIRQKTYDRVLGNPVHYLIFGSNSQRAVYAAEILTVALHKAKRITHNKLTRNVLKNERFTSSIENGMQIAKGGVLLLDLDDEYFDEIGNDHLARMMSEFARSLQRDKHDTQFILYSQNSEGRAITAILAELSSINFITFKERNLSRVEAINQLVTMLDEKGIDTVHSESILPLLGDEFSRIELKNHFSVWYDIYLRNVFFDQYKIVSQYAIQKVKEPDGDAYHTLKSLIGLQKVKGLVDDFLNFQKASIVFKKAGIKIQPISKHMVFTGLPGTAKTTVARLVGRIMRDNGLLTNGDLIEVSRADLVGEYVGWTAKAVQRVFSKAKGSVLFIDEAYSLVDGHRGSYGDEAINAIVQELENCRGNTMVIFAGYPKQMDDFLNNNPGLKSRVNFHIQFDNYKLPELLEIAQIMLQNLGFKINECGLKNLENRIRIEMAQPEFGNGRFIRNLIERAILNHGAKLFNQNLDNLDINEVQMLTEEDIPLVVDNDTPLRLESRDKRRTYN
jgi:hypothetical protein